MTSPTWHIRALTLLLVALSVVLVALLVSSCSSAYERTNPMPRICKELGKECR